MLRWIRPEQVTWAWGGSNSGWRGARESRAGMLTSSRLKLTHLPSGVEIAAEVPRGNYSRTQMKTKKAEIWSQAWIALDAAVAKKLRLPGQ